MGALGLKLFACLDVFAPLYCKVLKIDEMASLQIVHKRLAKARNEEPDVEAILALEGADEFYERDDLQRVKAVQKDAEDNRINRESFAVKYKARAVRIREAKAAAASEKPPPVKKLKPPADSVAAAPSEPPSIKIPFPSDTDGEICTAVAATLKPPGARLWRAHDQRNSWRGYLPSLHYRHAKEHISTLAESKLLLFAMEIAWGLRILTGDTLRPARASVEPGWAAVSY